MRIPGINREGELRGQLVNPGLPGKMAVKTECVFSFVINKYSLCYFVCRYYIYRSNYVNIFPRVLMLLIGRQNDIHP